MLVRAESGTLSGQATQGDLGGGVCCLWLMTTLRSFVNPHKRQFNPNTAVEGPVYVPLGGYVGEWDKEGANEVGTC